MRQVESHDDEDFGWHHVLMSIKTRSRSEEDHHMLMIFKSSCVDELSSQEPGLEVKMCVIKLQEDAQGKGMTS